MITAIHYYLTPIQTAKSLDSELQWKYFRISVKQIAHIKMCTHTHTHTLINTHSHTQNIYIYIYIYVCVCVCISTIPLHELESTHVDNFLKLSLTGLNSVFLFTLAGCLTKIKDLSLPYYLFKAKERLVGFLPFPSYEEPYVKCKHLLGFELRSTCPFSKTKAITHHSLSLSLYIYIYSIPKFTEFASLREHNMHLF